MENQAKKEISIQIYDSNKIDMPLAEKFAIGTQATLKWVSLACLTLQNAALNLLMRMSRTQGVLYASSTAVLMSELLKLVASLAMVAHVDEGSIRKALVALKKTIVQQPIDTLKVSVPSLVYLIQNNLLYLGATHLDAATCQVTYQLKILTTALFSVGMLGRKLGAHQWLALLILFVGIILVQLAELTSEAPSKSPHEQRPLLGFIAIVCACCLSGFAGVYFEKILKGSEVTVWMRNVQLCVSSIPLGLISVFVWDWKLVTSNTFFHGFTTLVWTVVILQALGGLVVAVVVRFADNILKGFSTSLAIVISSTLSVYLFDFQLTYKFVLGASLVIGSVFLYGHKPQSVNHRN